MTLQERLALLIAAIAPIGRAAHAREPAATAGSYLTAAINATALTTLAGAAGRMDLYPYIPGRNISVDLLSIEVTTLVAGAQARIGMYSSNAAGAPAQLLTGAGTLLDCGSTGAKNSTLAPSPLVLVKGNIYWLAVLSSSTAAVRALSSNAVMPLSGAATGGSHNTILRATGLTFASGLPTTAPVGAARAPNIAPPLVRLRLA